MFNTYGRFLKMVAGTMVSLLALLSVTACYSEPEQIVTADEADSIAIREALNNADSIRAEKAVFSWGDSWKIYADEVFVGEVRGIPIYLIGDTYSLFTPDGNLVGSESENFKIINASADIYDHYNENVGRIEQELTFFLMKLNVFENDVNVGQVSQKFALNLDADIKNMSSDSEWNVSRHFLSFGAKVDVTRVANGETDVDGINALWTALMMNEIYEAQQENSNNGQNN